MPLLSKHSPIGIDLADDRVQLTQLKTTSKGLSLLAFGGWSWSQAPHGPVDHDDVPQQARLIAEVISEGKFKGRDIVVRVPDSLLRLKNVRIPPIPDEDLPAACRWEASERFQLDPEQSTIRFYDTGQVQQAGEAKREVILLAAPTPPLLQLAEELDRNGLRIRSFDPTPELLSRFQHVIEANGITTPDEIERPRLIVHVGPSHTWVLISEKQQVVFLRQMPFGVNDFDKPVTPDASPETDHGTYGLRVPIDREEAEAKSPLKQIDLPNEIALCLRYHGVTFPGKRPDTAWLIAPESLAKQLAPQIASRASVKVMLPSEFDLRLPELYDAIGRPLASMASSIGLAMNWPGGKLAA
ncbi:hypothetical protein [Mucisphaera sp.]|uniref:hypothetical protein n=1 Tax=Mucisphaera sp. TaxID=2913024 RepID=UPI003D0A005E